MSIIAARTPLSTLMAKLSQAILFTLLCIAFSCCTRFQPGDNVKGEACFNEPNNGLLRRNQKHSFAIGTQHLQEYCLKKTVAKRHSKRSL